MSQSGKIKDTGGVLPPDVATSYICDVGIAVPAANVLDVNGGTSIQTVGSGNQILINFTGSGGGVTSVTGTSPITASPTTGAVVVSIANATTTTLGAASFNTANFTVVSGAVSSQNFTITAGSGLSGGGSLTLGGSVTLSVNGSVVGQTITGNSGGALSPTAGNWNILGTGSITTSGAGSTLTASLTGLTNHAVQVGAGTATLTQLAVGTSGQVLIAATAADPAFATLTSSDGSITFTTGANTLSLQVAGGSTAIKTITGNSGGAEVPSAGNFNILGTGSITVAGSANTETVQLTGITNHAIQIGAGTATLTQLGAGSTGQILQTNTTADPTWSTATYPSTATGTGTILRADGTNWVATTATYPATTTINQILYSTSNNVIGGVTASNNGVFISGTTGIPSWLAAGTTGQVLTATTGSPPSWASPATSGTVTSVSVVTANGFAGSVATATTTPAITITTTQTGVLSGNGTAISGSAITQYDVLVGGASNAVSSVGPGSSGQVLQSGGNAANPAYSTATYPSTATGTGTILRADGTNWVATTATYPATTTINQILYSSSASVVTGLATANNGILTTGTTGIPVITALGTDGQIIIGSSAGAPAAATITAGTNVTVTNGHNTITIAAGTTSQVVAYTAVNHAASPYTVLSTDYYLGVDPSAGVVTINLPNGPTTGRIFVVKDSTGSSNSHSITVTTVGGSVTIDGATTNTINISYRSLSLIFNGTSYEIY